MTREAMHVAGLRPETPWLLSGGQASLGAPSLQTDSHASCILLPASLRAIDVVMSVAPFCGME